MQREQSSSFIGAWRVHRRAVSITGAIVYCAGRNNCFKLFLSSVCALFPRRNPGDPLFGRGNALNSARFLGEKKNRRFDSMGLFSTLLFPSFRKIFQRVVFNALHSMTPCRSILKRAIRASPPTIFSGMSKIARSFTE